MYQTYLAMKQGWIVQRLVSLVGNYLHLTELTHKINFTNIFLKNCSVFFFFFLYSTFENSVSQLMMSLVLNN